jgi:hypothetical protein
MDQETNSVEEVLYGIRDYVVIGSAVELDCTALVSRYRQIDRTGIVWRKGARPRVCSFTRTQATGMTSNKYYVWEAETVVPSCFQPSSTDQTFLF